MTGNGKPGSGPETKKIKLYVVEEQEILCQAYESTFSVEPTIDIVGIVSGRDGEAIVSALTELNPDVLLLGTKMLQSDIIEKLGIVRRHHPDVGIILLAALYDIKGMKQLREFAGRSSKGCAFLLKHSIDRTEQLVRVIRAVTEGRVIIDPLVKDGLFGVSDARIAHLKAPTHREVDDLSRTADAMTTFLKGLTRRELEVLSCMAKELKNTAIAEVLCVDPRTVKCHINSIYNKAGRFDSKHPRVSAIMLYLKAIGRLTGDEIRRESPLPFSDRRRIEHSNLCLS